MKSSELSRLAQQPQLERLWCVMGRPRCWLVGGFIRDLLCGRRSADVDLVLEGSAQEVEAPARALGRELAGPVHLLGRPPRCIWRIEGRGLKVELWPLGDLSLEEDALRRDFSCNALLWQLPKGPLVDLVGGAADIRARVLRAVRRHNLASDPVRLLRGPRFLAALPEFELEDTTRRWISELAPRLAAAPRERVGAELGALLATTRPDRGLAEVEELGLLEGIGPRHLPPDRDWFERSLHATALCADPRRHPLPASLREAGPAAALAWLARLWRPDEAKQLNAFGWPRRGLQLGWRAATLIDHASARTVAGARARRLLVHEAGPALPALVALGAALDHDDPELVAGWRRLWRLWRRRGPVLVHPEPLLTAPELIKLLELEQGPQVGRAMDALIRAQLEGRVRSANGAKRWMREWWEELRIMN